jgi:hypothetical protein
MRPWFFLILGPLAVPCASTQLPGLVAPFQGAGVIKARINELNEKAVNVNTCTAGMSPTDKGGIVEVTADAQGQVRARTIKWEGDPAIEKCLLEGAAKLTLSPLPGPSISTFWQFTSPHAEPLPAPDLTMVSENDMHAVQERLTPEVDACAQRNLPPEFPADVEVSFFLYGAGKVAAVNVTYSTAKDGNFEACVQELVTAASFPKPNYGGLFPVKLRFHVGRLEAL